MKRDLARRPASLLLSGLLLLAACGVSSEAEVTPAGEPLGTREAAICSGTSVSTLSLAGISTYQGEMAGAGDWAVTYPANAVRLEYYVDGTLIGTAERCNASGGLSSCTGSGSWSFSLAGVSCGAHTFQIKAYPMTISSAGDRETCWSNVRVLTQTVGENCTAKAATTTSHFSVARDGENNLWAWGDNWAGQFGDGTTTTTRKVPAKMPGISNVKEVSLGFYHTVALKHDGTVWTWGYNGSGQLGDGTTTTRNTPGIVPGLSGIVAIAAGGSFNLALKNDGTVWSWGDNWTGPLGDGTEITRLSPVRVVGLTGVTALAAGINHSVALRNDGTVWAWGRNMAGELGDGTATVRTTPVRAQGLTGVVSIAASYWQTMAVKSDGTGWVWGRNWAGQVGDGTNTDRYTPVQVLSGVKAMSGGFGHTVAVRNDGTVWTWGDNSQGQLGNGTTTGRNVPGQVPGMSGVSTVATGSNAVYNTVVVKNDGSVWAWGSDNTSSSGVLGDGVSSKSLTPVRVLNLGP
ncbi:MAG TPA: hypothetical protein VFZ09_11210 [Archangium sp.]|uniref:RCC1 domain-containing protein n=1 Tax=Archangium sp. TaxID=1872627 RepID=UPI002E30F0B2|nr:hypothetical protein [Archangium sp.]HEX5746806.1 hypothetical protein [Archangium sp.]